MNHDQQLSELRRQEDFLYQKERAILKEKRSLEDEMNRFEGYSSEAHRLLWNSFESYPSSRNLFDQLQEEVLHESRKISNSYLEELEELDRQKRKIEDDLNDIYHDRKKIYLEQESDNGDRSLSR
nr:DUF3958 family protein [uncultured Streptococcus sp.]